MLGLVIILVNEEVRKWGLHAATRLATMRPYKRRTLVDGFSLRYVATLPCTVVARKNQLINIPKSKKPDSIGFLAPRLRKIRDPHLTRNP